MPEGVGVYGPRETDYYLMAESIKKHLDFAAGFRRQDITFVYVKDLVQAIYLALEKQVVCRSYFVSDGEVYSSRTFSDLIWNELGRPWMLRFVCPIGLLKVISFISENIGKLMHKPTTLNNDKYRIMKLLPQDGIVLGNSQCHIKPPYCFKSASSSASKS